jgi:sirohydrochlorin cobaltochelatase
MKQGLILFAHGARDPRWALPFESIAARSRLAAPSVDVQLAFLELMSPSLLDAGSAMAEAGCQHVHVMPLFLAAGGHVRQDLPRLLDELARKHPAVRWTSSPPVGELDAVMAAMAQAAVAALDEQ